MITPETSPKGSWVRWTGPIAPGQTEDNRIAQVLYWTPAWEVKVRDWKSGVTNQMTELETHLFEPFDPLAVVVPMDPQCECGVGWVGGIHSDWCAAR